MNNINKLNLISNQEASSNKTRFSTDQASENDTKDTKKIAQQAINAIHQQRVNYDFSHYYEPQEETNKKNAIKFIA